jgi:hypothetical protein
MSELTLAALRQQLETDIRSGGRDGLTTAENVRHFLGQLLTELEAQEAAQATPPNVVHLDGAETITGLKTFAGDILLGNGQDGSGLKIRQLGGDGYQRVFDLTNVGRANSVNFGAVGLGGDLRAHGTTHRWLNNGGSQTYMQLDEQGTLAVSGPVQAPAFVGDGSRLTGLPSQPTLEFVFGPGYADSYTATCGTGQAGYYTGQVTNNIGQVSYVRNGTETLRPPFTLAAGDTLAVAITRAKADQPAVLSLQATQPVISEI